MRPVLIDYYADRVRINRVAVAFKSILTDRQKYSLLRAFPPLSITIHKEYDQWRKKL